MNMNKVEPNHRRGKKSKLRLSTHRYKRKVFPQRKKSDTNELKVSI